MTPLEAVNMVRMLLDEARESFVNIDFINNAINSVIMQKTRQYYTAGDERYLRPLYRQGYGAGGINMISGEDILTSTGAVANVLYPRSCRIFLPNARTEGTDVNNRATTMVATYIENGRYFNFVESTITANGFNSVYPSSVFPRSGMYTIQKSTNYVLHFIAPNGTENANIWYIKYPQTFLYIDNDVANSIGFEMPEEYHPSIVMKAAELINNIDVDELERGKAVFQNQKIDIEGMGL